MRSEHCKIMFLACFFAACAHGVRVNRHAAGGESHADVHRAGFVPWSVNTLHVPRGRSPKMAVTARQVGDRGAKSEAALRKKMAILDAVKQRLEDSKLIFALPSEGLTVKEMETLRKMLPETTSAGVVKNTIMNRALQDYDGYEGLEALLKKPNMWFFSDEDNIRDTVEAIKKWTKTLENGDDYVVSGGALESDVLDSAGIMDLVKMPTRKELMQKIAILTRQVPQKVASSIHQAANAPERVARGIKQVAEKLSRGIEQIP